MTTSIHQPNDKLFKLSLAKIPVAKEFFLAHLPADILKQIDLNTLEFQKETFIDEAYKSTEADVVYKVTIGNTVGYLYLLCEHQTEVDQWLAFRLLGYMTRIMALHHQQNPTDPLPVVYPIVVYAGEKPWDAPLDIFQLFGEAESLARSTFLKPYQLWDIHRTDDDELRQEQLSGIMAFSLKYRKTRDFKQFLKSFLPWLHEIEIQHDETCGKAFGRILLKYIIDASPQGNKELLVQEAQHYLSQTLQGDIMTIAQQWKEEGMQQGMLIAHQWKDEGMQQGMLIAHQWKDEGMQQGMQQGMQKGEAAILKRQLKHRFGNISPVYEQKINLADSETLLYWSERILAAKTPEDIFL